MNIYALMVERAARIVKPSGIVGLLVPSGIAADLGAAPFFEVSAQAAAWRRCWVSRSTAQAATPAVFPDVDSRFKFCTLIFGGADMADVSAPATWC